MTENQAPYKTEADEAMEMLGKGYEIRDEAPHNHYTTIPNMVDDMDISPLAFRLYCHIRRVAGEDGKCWQSTATLAKGCKMSMGAISKCKKELASTTPPLIRVDRVYRKIGGKNADFYHSITITDIWRVNNARYAQVAATPSPHEAPPSRSEHPPSPHERKNNPIKNNPVHLSLTPAQKNSLALFNDALGRFNSENECTRWLAIVEKYPHRAAALLEWAARKEIHLTNRASLMDSLETAAKSWQDKPARIPPARVEPEYRTL